MKQKLYTLDAFLIKKLKLSENDPYIYLHHQYLKTTNPFSLPLEYIQNDD